MTRIYVDGKLVTKEELSKCEFKQEPLKRILANGHSKRKEQKGS